MKLPAKQNLAVALLASGKKGCEVASELSITPQTISEWKRQPAFVAELNKLQMEGVRAARTKIQQSATEAVDALLEIVKEAPNPDTRRKAAVDLLKFGSFEPNSVETYGSGIGPETADSIQEKWDREEKLRRMLSEIVQLIGRKATLW